MSPASRTSHFTLLPTMNTTKWFQLFLLAFCLFTLTACDAPFPAGNDQVNPNSSFNISEVDLFGQGGPNGTIGAIWSNPAGDNSASAPDLSQAKLTLKPNSTYLFALYSVALVNKSNYTDEGGAFQDGFTIINGDLFYHLVNKWPGQYLVRISSQPANLISSIFYKDDDRVFFFQLDRPLKPLGRTFSITTGNGTVASGNLTIQILRRADKSSLSNANGPAQPMLPVLDSTSLGTQIEDVKATFSVEVKN